MPPGCTEGMIPGNRQFDIEIEKLFDELDGTIVMFLKESDHVDKADIPQVLRDLLTQFERELRNELLDNGRPHGTHPTMGECECDECQKYDEAERKERESDERRPEADPTDDQDKDPNHLEV